MSEMGDASSGTLVKPHNSVNQPDTDVCGQPSDDPSLALNVEMDAAQPRLTHVQRKGA